MARKIFRLIFLVAGCLYLAGTAWAGSGIFINGEEVPEAEAEKAKVIAPGQTYEYVGDTTDPGTRSYNEQRAEERRRALDREDAATNKKESGREIRREIDRRIRYHELGVL